MVGYVYKEAQSMNLKHSRWVYGNRLNMWYPVGSDDRDYNNGLSQEWIDTHTETQAIQAYLSSFFNGAIGSAIKQGLIKDVYIKQ